MSGWPVLACRAPTISPQPHTLPPPPHPVLLLTCTPPRRASSTRYLTCRSPTLTSGRYSRANRIYAHEGVGGRAGGRAGGWWLSVRGARQQQAAAGSTSNRQRQQQQAAGSCARLRAQPVGGVLSLSNDLCCRVLEARCRVGRDHALLRCPGHVGGEGDGDAVQKVLTQRPLLGVVGGDQQRFAAAWRGGWG